MPSASGGDSGPTSRPATSAASTTCRGWARSVSSAVRHAAVTPGPESRSAARRFSPIPGTWLSSSIAAEPAVLLAVVEDPLRDPGPDPVERVELLEGRGVQVDGRARQSAGTGDPALDAGRVGAGRGRPSARRARAGHPAPRRHDDLAAVLDLGREVERAELGAPGRPAGLPNRVVDPRARGHAVDAGTPDLAGDVDQRRPAVA